MSRTSGLARDLTDILNKMNERFEADPNMQQYIQHENTKKFELEGTEQCKKCKKMTAISMTKQMRAGDEGETTIIECYSCGNTYRPN